ncbi:DUF503 domain-containing protein [bacterium]|nr:DUF503 domain-containing protein [bacterium]MBU1063707.1 DUF503 domain-containing protein [bacterium]MBU1634389.1 DUF503 domain-containing protein [bacterium]MBU1874328.1 DUF503 domain-containing protein [bacterium]
MELLLPETHSLKDKRSVLSRIKNGARKQFNVSVAELRYHDQFSRTLLGIVTINNETRIIDQILGPVEQFVERQAGIQVLNRKVEII